MFEFPDAKRVRREDLYDSSAGEEDDRDEEVISVLRDKLNAQLSGLLNVSFADTSNDAQPQDQDQDQQQPEHGGDHDAAEDEFAFSFRLFRDEAPSHKVVLEQDDGPEQAGGGGFVIPKRPTSYYIAQGPSPDAIARFRATAVTPDYLFLDAKKRRWGLEKPWRVMSITVTTKSAAQTSENSRAEAPAADPAGKRKRPGKRRRITLRTRQKARKEREEAEKLKLVEKEEHLKEKKKRLNREKKLKRRAKERGKKIASKGEGAVSEQNSSRATSPE